MAEQLAGYRVGDAVRLPSVPGVFQVVDLEPPSLLVLRSPGGRLVKAGWKAVRRQAVVPPREPPE